MERITDPKQFPQEIIFKAIFRTESCARDSIKSSLSGKGITHTITDRASGKGNFISFTITAVFESEERLNQTCTEIKSIDGFMTMI